MLHATPTPSGTVSVEQYDSIGRQTYGRWHVGQDEVITRSQWLGHLRAGRIQDAGDDPFREVASFDGFGRRTGWVYSALDLENDEPVDPVWADEYCQSSTSSWNIAECGLPLLTIDMERSASGRVQETAAVYGFPNGSSTSISGDNLFEYASPGHLSYSAQHFVGKRTISREEKVGAVDLTVRSNQPEWAAKRGMGHELVEVYVDDATYPIAHDHDGRIVEGPGWDAKFDQSDKLVNIDVSGTAESYLYDHRGQLAGVINQSGVTAFAYDGPQIIGAYDHKGNSVWEALWGPGIDNLHGFKGGKGGLQLPMSDYRNSVVATWSVDDAEVKGFVEYDPNGRATVFDKRGSVDCQEEGNPGLVCHHPSGIPFGFNSAWRSGVSGMIHMRARWYSPRLGQFVSTDPLGYIDSYNLYAFAGFDPINWWDPSGMSAFLGFWDGAVDMAGGLGNLALGLVIRPIDTRRELVRGIATGIGDGYDEDGLRGVANYFNPFLDMLIGGWEAKEAYQTGRNRDAGRAVFDSLMGGVGVLGTVVGAGAAIKGVKVAKTAPKRPCSSFVEGTEVLMCDGSLKPIEDVTPGDLVWARDVASGEFGCRAVDEHYLTQDRAIVELELIDELGRTEMFWTTPNHPFWHAEEHRWVLAEDLAPGDALVSAYGGWLRVGSATWTSYVQDVYNFKVDGFESYFVGESGVWVSNCSGKRANAAPEPEVQAFINEFEAAYPGRAYQSGHKRRHSDGREIEIDFETDNAIIEFKRGKGTGLANQLVDRLDPSMNPHGKVCIGVACRSKGMSPHARKSIEEVGGLGYGNGFDFQLLLELIVPD